MQNTSIENNTKTSRAQEFINAVQLGWEAWKEAGKIVVEELEKNPDFANEVCILSKGFISVEMVHQFELLGRNKVLPQLLIDWHKPGIKKLMRLPIHIQEKHSSNPVDVVIFNDDGDMDILPVHPRNMTPQQAKQVFETSAIRTPAAQRAWIESAKSKKQIESAVSVNGDPVYVIEGDLVHFTKPCQFTIMELMRVLINRK